MKTPAVLALCAALLGAGYFFGSANKPVEATRANVFDQFDTPAGVVWDATPQIEARAPPERTYQHSADIDEINANLRAQQDQQRASQELAYEMDQQASDRKREHREQMRAIEDARREAERAARGY